MIEVHCVVFNDDFDGIPFGRLIAGAYTDKAVAEIHAAAIGYTVKTIVVDREPPIEAWRSGLMFYRVYFEAPTIDYIRTTVCDDIDQAGTWSAFESVTVGQYGFMFYTWATDQYQAATLACETRVALIESGKLVESDAIAKPRITIKLDGGVS